MTPPAAPPASPAPLALRHELARKTIHLTTAAFPVAYAAGLPRPWLVWLLTALCATAVAAELGRARHERTRALLERAAGGLFREHERARWSGATWLAVALLAAAVLFPRDVATAAMWAASVGDAAAAIVGRSVGARRAKHPSRPRGAPPELHDRAGELPQRKLPDARRAESPRPAPKSLAGSLACALATAAGALLVAHLPPAEALAAAVVAALAERPRAPLDDNIRVVVAVGGALLALRALGA